MPYRCGIIEDEPLAEDMLKRYLDRFPFIEIAWVCSYAEEAVELVIDPKVDLLILDLQSVPIRKDSAFYQLLHTHKNIIVCSAYPIQMVNIPLNVMGFLNKPFTFEQFTDVIEKFVAVVDDY